MNYTKLIKNWEPDELYRFDSSLLYSKGLNEDTVDFLSIIGLPISAAPFLGFADNDIYKELESIYSIYETGDLEHQNLLCIGFDVAGDLICLDLRNDCQIVALTHEKELLPSFINSSVLELFQFLTLYKKFGEELNRTNGENAFLDANFTDRQYDELKKAMEAIDKEALAESAFWTHELDLLLENREFYLNQNKSYRC